MHDAFGGTGRARGKGQIEHLIGITGGRRQKGRWLGELIRLVDDLQGSDPAHHLFQRLLGAAAKADFGHQSLGRQALQQARNIGFRIGPVQGRIAGKALARAGQKSDNAFGAVGSPDRDTVAFDETKTAQIGGHAVDPQFQLGKGLAASAIHQRDSIGPLGRVAGEQAVKCVGTPQALVIIGLGGSRMVESQKLLHA